MILDAVRDRAMGAGYAAGWGLVRTMPGGVASRAFRSAADAAAIRNGKGARQLRKNLRRVVGRRMSESRMDELVGDALRSYSRYWLETFRLETMDHYAIARSIDAHSEGEEHIVAGLERGKGVILALPHSGNWDASAVWLVDQHGSFTTVAERLKPASLFERFVEYRESIGMEVVPLTGGERAPTVVLTERLRENKVICLLADRDLSHNGVEVTFFGERAKMPAGPALLAATTGASFHAVHPRFVGNGWGHFISPPIELPDGRLRHRVVSATQTMADLFAVQIARDPTDWHMLQRLWLADLPQRAVRSEHTQRAATAKV